MQDSTSPAHQTTITRFWERYIKITQKQSITKPFERWYVLRAQAYIDVPPGMRLKEHQASDLTNYLKALGRTSGLKDWQFRQAIDAIRILLVEMVGLEWARSFDWEYWRESVRSLQASHPTVARDYDPIRWDGQNSERGGCRETKAMCQGLFKRFIAEVRRRGYPFVQNRRMRPGFVISSPFTARAIPHLWDHKRCLDFWSIWRWGVKWRPVNRIWH